MSQWRRWYFNADSTRNRVVYFRNLVIRSWNFLLPDPLVPAILSVVALIFIPISESQTTIRIEHFPNPPKHMWSEERAQGGISPLSAVVPVIQRTHGGTPGYYQITRYLDLGGTVFNSYDTMDLGAPKVMHLVILASLDSMRLSDLPEMQTPGARINTDSLRVAPLMKVRLTGSALEIIAAGDSIQPVERNRYTRWAWTVTPRRIGQSELVIALSVVFQDLGTERVKNELIVRRPIQVIAGQSLGKHQDSPPERSDTVDQSQASSGSTEASLTPRMKMGAAFFAITLVFLFVAYFVRGVSHQGYVILRFFMALSAGLAGGLMTGEAVIRSSNTVPAGVQFAISGSAGFALFIFVWWKFPKEPPPPIQSAFQVDVQEGWTFEHAVNVVVEEQHAFAHFEGFSKQELATKLRPRVIKARDATHALSLLRALAARGGIRPYDVTSGDSVYYLRRRQGP